MEGKNPRVLLENAAHNFALHTCAAAMNDSNFLEPGLRALLEIFLDDARNIFGSEGVEIYGIFDGENDRFTER
jgi:hypothetical protein